MASDSSSNDSPTKSQPDQPQVFHTTHTFQSHSNFITGPKLSIKLDEKNFLIWNQQVEGVILTHNLHRLLVHPQIPVKFNNTADETANKLSPEYEKWIVQDQALYTWLLSTLSETVLPRVLNCKHAYQVWDKIHTHFFSHLKAKARQLRTELKFLKKGSKPISEFLTKIHTIADPYCYW